MTDKEKRIRKQAREELRDRGILPPRKAKLNRREYAKKVLERYNRQPVDWVFYAHLCEAIIYMVPESAVVTSVSAEQVGVLKMLNIALDIQDYIRQQREKGFEPNYLEVWDRIVKPIWNL